MNATRRPLGRFLRLRAILDCAQFCAHLQDFQRLFRLHRLAGDNTVTVLLGDGRCGFKPAPGSPFPAGAVPWSVAIGDLNNDGIPDLVIIPYGPQVHDTGKVAATVLLGDGHGGFRTMPGSPFALPGCVNPRRVATGSIYGNKLHDFVVTCTNSSTILLFAGQKGGIYTVIVAYG